MQFFISFFKGNNRKIKVKGSSVAFARPQGQVALNPSTCPWALGPSHAAHFGHGDSEVLHSRLEDGCSWQDSTRYEIAFP